MRFTLLTLMLLIFFAAVLCGVFFALPGFWSVVVLAAIMAVLPAPIVAGICYGRGYGRAFAIGCASVAWAPVLYQLYTMSFVFLGFPGLDEESLRLRIIYAVFFTLIAVAGVLSMVTRWLALRPERIRRRTLGESPFGEPAKSAESARG